MIEARVTAAELMAAHEVGGIVERRLATLLIERGIKFREDCPFMPRVEDMVPPWKWWHDEATGDLIVRQGEEPDPSRSAK